MSPRKTLSTLAPAMLAATLGACATAPAPQLAATEGTSLESCQQVTGSRIRTDRATCAPVGYPYKSFSKEDIESTGQIDLLQALRQLNPAFQ